MPAITPRTTSAALAALLLVVSLTACSGEPTAAPSPSTTPTKPASTPRPTPAASKTPQLPEEAPACDTIVSQGTVTALTENGWSFEEKDFVIGDVAMRHGLLCFWADYSAASDHGQLYGWSKISAADAAKAQSSLLADGWKREDDANGIYITEDPQYALSLDDDGYGMTYLFGDGWVKVADTRQGLLLVDWVD